MHLNLELPPEFLNTIREAVRVEMESFVSERNADYDHQLMTISEVADFMRVSISTVRHFMNLGLPHFQEGQVIRFVKSEVIVWTKSERRKALK